ncbi:MAG: 30S ribosomal protein S16 [Bdellovibrionales bacterium]|nr:30S ribosomal protein S16 [Bdellovibrionales bacterium]
MVRIRLARFGQKHDPRYRITVADQRRAAKKKFIEVIGHFNPSAQGKAVKLNVDMDKVNAWIAKGAQPTKRVKSLLKQVAGQ